MKENLRKKIKEKKRDVCLSTCYTKEKLIYCYRKRLLPKDDTESLRSLANYLCFLLIALFKEGGRIIETLQKYLKKKKRGIKLYVKMQAVACIFSRDTFDDYAFPKSNSVGRYKMPWDDTRSSHWKSTV